MWWFWEAFVVRVGGEVLVVMSGWVLLHFGAALGGLHVGERSCI